MNGAPVGPDPATDPPAEADVPAGWVADPQLVERWLWWDGAEYTQVATPMPSGWTYRPAPTRGRPVGPSGARVRLVGLVAVGVVVLAGSLVAVGLALAHLPSTQPCPESLPVSRGWVVVAGLGVLGLAALAAAGQRSVRLAPDDRVLRWAVRAGVLAVLLPIAAAVVLYVGAAANCAL